MAFAAGSGKWRLLSSRNAETQDILNNHASAAFTAGQAVHYTSGTLAAIGDDNTTGIHAVLADDVANGDRVGGYISGLFEVDVDGTVDFAIDDAVYSSTSGKVDKGSTSDIEVARLAPYENPASGASQVKVLMRSLFFARDLLTHA